jgi:hypothetical protein
LADLNFLLLFHLPSALRQCLLCRRLQFVDRNKRTQHTHRHRLRSSNPYRKQALAVRSCAIRSDWRNRIKVERSARSRFKHMALMHDDYCTRACNADWQICFYRKSK